MTRRRRPEGSRGWLVPAGVGVTAALVYVATACRGPYWDDSTELILACRELGVVHPTGYPLYALLGHILALVAPGPLPFRIVLLSALPAAMGVALACRVMMACGADATTAAVSSLLLAFAHEVWDQATLQEVYGLHMCILAGLHLAILSAWMRPGSRTLGRLALLCGLAVTHHMKAAFTVLAVGLGVMGSARMREGVTGGMWEGCKGGGAAGPARLVTLFAIPLALYLVLPIRSIQGVLMDNGHVQSLRAMIDHVRGRQFAYRMFTLPPGGSVSGEIARLVKFLGVQMTPGFAGSLILAPAAIWGLAVLARRGPRGAGVIAAGVLGDLVFTLGYNIPDKDAYFIPVLLILAYGLAIGLNSALEAAFTALTVRSTGTRAAVRGVLVVLVLVPLVGNEAAVDRSADTTGIDYPADLMASTPPGSVLLVDDLGLSMLLEYRRLVERLDGDKAVVCTYLLRLPWYLTMLGRLYPDLAWPAGAREALVAGVSRLAQAGGDVGEESQRLVDTLAEALVAENLPRRPVCLALYDNTAERKTWGSGGRFHLQNRGLCYRIVAGGPEPPPEAWEGGYADPARYCLTELPPGRRSWVARRYSTSLNRLGIVLIGLGRLAQARDTFLRALKYEPNYAQVYLNLGVLYSSHLRQPGDAYDAFQKVLAINPSLDAGGQIRAWCRGYRETTGRGAP